MKRNMIHLISLFVFTLKAYAVTDSSEVPMLTISNDVVQNTAINWPALCLNDQDLLNATGCTPDCNSIAMAGTCNQLFNASRIEKTSYISRPYSSNGVFIYQLNPVLATKNARFTLVVAAAPAPGNGYICELLYRDGTPATLWNTRSKVGVSSSTIAIDSSCIQPCKSSNYTNYMVQLDGSSQTYFWYNNPNEPLYLLCLAYNQTGTVPAQLQSISGCSGTSGDCVSYLLQ